MVSCLNSFRLQALFVIFWIKILGSVLKVMLMTFSYELPSALADGKRLDHKIGFSRISLKAKSLIALAEAIRMIDNFLSLAKAASPNIN